MTDPATEIDVNEVRVPIGSGCAECARLREEAAGLADALHRIIAKTNDSRIEGIAMDALQRWVRS